MPIEGADYFVRVIPFPDGCDNGGMVLLNDDGTYSVYLNERYPEKWPAAAGHELGHIRRDDIDSTVSIAEGLSEE